MYLTPLRPTTDATFTIDPFLALIIQGKTVLVVRNTASKLALKLVFQAARSRSTIFPT